MAPEGRHIIAVFKTASVLKEKGIYHMTKATITTLSDPSGFSPDPLTETGIGTEQVKVPCVRDRGDGTEKVRFTSAILPP